MEAVDTRVYFGNPQVWEVQKQPYIIVSAAAALSVGRRPKTSTARTPGSITADDDPNGVNQGAGERQVRRAHQVLGAGDGAVQQDNGGRGGQPTKPTWVTGFTRWPGFRG